MKKQILVNAGIVLVLAVIAYGCYITGKAYDVVVENLPYTVNGEQKPGIEALQASIDGQEPLYLLEGDRLVGTAVGLSHVMVIEILDLDDKPIPDLTRTVNFTIEELGEKMEINVPMFYERVK